MPYIFYIENMNQPDLVFRKIALCENALITKFVETVCDSFGLKAKNILDYDIKNDDIRISASQLENMPLFKKKKFGFDHIFKEQSECQLNIKHTLGTLQMQVILVEKLEEKMEVPLILQGKGRLSISAKR